MSSGCLSLLLLYLSAVPFSTQPATRAKCAPVAGHTQLLSVATPHLSHSYQAKREKHLDQKSVAEELLELSLWLFFRFHFAGFKVLCFKATKYMEGFDEKLGIEINADWLLSELFFAGTGNYVNLS